MTSTVALTLAAKSSILKYLLWKNWFQGVRNKEMFSYFWICMGIPFWKTASSTAQEASTHLPSGVKLLWYSEAPPLSLVAQLQIFSLDFLQVQNIKRKHINCSSVLPAPGINLKLYLLKFIGPLPKSKSDLSNAGQRLAEFWTELNAVNGINLC